MEPVTGLRYVKGRHLGVDKRQALDGRYMQNCIKRYTTYYLLEAMRVSHVVLLASRRKNATESHKDPSGYSFSPFFFVLTEMLLSAQKFALVMHVFTSAPVFRNTVTK